jgi:hypothetical protein
MRGVVTDVRPSNCTHGVCYCNDCQAFARWLGIDGVMNERGGTDIVQIAPAQVRWTAGADRLRCVRLAPKGMVRWYSDCCRTPAGNTVSARVPFVGLPRPAFVELPIEAVGPAVGANGRFAIGGVPPDVHARAPLGFIAHAVWMLTRWWIGGKGRPSPYFDEQTGAPRSTPTMLDATERARLDVARSSDR